MTRVDIFDSPTADPRSILNTAPENLAIGEIKKRQTKTLTLICKISRIFLLFALFQLTRPLEIDGRHLNLE